ncbi:hypothetical protein V2J09_001397 [Rumex salicifolius]
MGGNGGGSSSSLAPGFRFHPTDEELVAYYLKRKVSGKPFRVDAISEIEVYRVEPWDLPGLSKLKTRDLEWYFFSNLDKKYSNGSKTNRATSEGYWKTTGKDRPVCHRCKVVGMKKTLVFHRGRAPRGERTNWVMHEYRLIDEQVEQAAVPQESFVLCRIFQKSGSGPKNGERYGAPLIEEEWEAEDVEGDILPGEPKADEVFITDDLFTEGNDYDQNLFAELPLEDPNPLLNAYQGDGSSFIEDLAKSELDPSPLLNEDQLGLETYDDKKFFNLPVQHELEAVKNEYAALPTNVNLASSSYEGFYLETNDLSEPIEAKSSGLQLLDEYLTYFDAENDITQYLTFDEPESLDDNVNPSDQAYLRDQVAFCTQAFLSLSFDNSVIVLQNLDQDTKQASTSNQKLPAPDAYGAESASSSKQAMETQKFEPGKYKLYRKFLALIVKVNFSDFKYPFMKQESQMLDKFPAFASDFPSKNLKSKLHSAVHSSESIRVTAGMVRIRDLSLDNNSGIHWSLDKRGNVNIVLSFDLPEGVFVNPAGIKAFTGMISHKMTSALSHDWAYYLFSLMLLLMSAKIGTYIYARLACVDCKLNIESRDVEIIV